jgi:hypothetical protein
LYFIPASRRQYIAAVRAWQRQSWTGSPRDSGAPVLPLERAREAHELVEAGAATRKVVLVS